MACSNLTRPPFGLLVLLASAARAPLAQEPAFKLTYGAMPRSTDSPASFLFTGSVDGMRIDHRNALANCCLEFAPIVELLDGVINVTETDQGPPCGCADVPVDLFVELQGLLPGSYDVYVRNEGQHILATAAVVVPETPTMMLVRGAVNDDGAADMSDAVFVLAYLFLDGKRPRCLDSADANDDGAVDVSDAVYLLSYLFGGGPAPPEPFASPGEDPTEDSISCPLGNSVLAQDFIRSGDVDGDGERSISDGVRLLGFLFLGQSAPICEDAADVNDDGRLDMTDLCFIVPQLCPVPLSEPPGEFPDPQECGPDVTPDRLGCEGPGCGF